MSSARGSFSHIVSQIAIIILTIGLATQIISYSVLKGFQQAIRNKVYDLSGHLIIDRYTLGGLPDVNYISKNSEFYKNLGQYPFIEKADDIIVKQMLLQSDEEVTGVVAKGVSNSFFLHRSLPIISGTILSTVDTIRLKQCLISNMQAKALQVNVGDTLMALFLQNPPRYRKLFVTGIYATGLEEFDKQTVFTDKDLLQKMNQWPDSLASHFEIMVDGTVSPNQASALLFDKIDYDLYVQSADEKYSQIFDWLNLLERNVAVLLVLIWCVSGFNMVSIVLILTLERTQMIGILNAMGATMNQLASIFRYKTAHIMLWGFIWGNGLAIMLCFIQYQWKLIPLDEANYYMSYVPIRWDWFSWLGINIITIFIVLLSVIIPLRLIRKMPILKALHFRS